MNDTRYSSLSASASASDPGSRFPEADANTFRFFYNVGDDPPAPLPLRVGSRIES